MLPLDIVEEIIKTHPVKSLIQFRSVSKTWKSMIDSSRFIASHYRHVQHLRAMYYVCWYGVPRHVTIVDDNSSPQQRVSVTVPLLVNSYRHHLVIGSSHGLLCLYGIYRRSHNFPFPGKHMGVIWNVSIGKAVAVMENDVEDKTYTTVIGFGVCRETLDPKIVKIKHIYPQRPLEDGACIPWKVEVFALSIGAWRSLNNNPPRNSIMFSDSQVTVDGSIYWLATDTVRTYREYKSSNLIIAFDITSEEIREVKHPGGLANHFSRGLTISKLRESLVVLEHHVEANNLVFNAWMMDDGVSNSFTKLVTLSFNKPDVRVRGFKRTGEVVIEIVEDFRTRRLALYEPCSKRIDDLGFDVSKFPFSVQSYKETLLLLDQPDLVVYDQGKRCILQHSELKAFVEYMERINQ